MAEAGILGEDDRVALISGRLCVMSPIGSQHATCVRRLTHLFILAACEQAEVNVQNPVLLAPDSEPEPAMALLVPREDAYAARHPRPDEVLLIMEVSGLTLAFDQTTKLPLHAQVGIPEVWVVALDEDRVHVYRQPKADRYVEHTTADRAGSHTVQALPDAGPLTVEDVLGAQRQGGRDRSRITLSFPGDAGFDLRTDCSDDANLDAEFDIASLRISDDDDDEVNYRGAVNGGGPRIELESHDGRFTPRRQSSGYSRQIHQGSTARRLSNPSVCCTLAAWGAWPHAVLFFPDYPPTPWLRNAPLPSSNPTASVKS